MTRKSLVYCLTAILLVALVATACAPTATPTPAAPKPAAPAPTQAPTAAPKPAAPAPTQAAAPIAAPKPAAAPTTAAVAPTAAPKPATLRKIRFGNVAKAASAGTADFYIGKALGYFEAEGIEPDFFQTGGAPEATQLMTVGQIDIVAGLQDTVFEAASKGNRLPIKFVYNYNRAINYQLAVKAGSPIKSVKDLKGKKIGVLSLNSGGHIYAKVALREVGLNAETDAEYIAVGQSGQAGIALDQGRIDAIAGWGFDYVIMKNLGFKLEMLPHPPFIQEVEAGHVMAVPADLLKKEPQLIAGYLRAYAKSTIFYLENPQATVQLFWKLFPEAKPKGIDEAQALRETAEQLATRKPIAEVKPGVKWGSFSKPGWENYIKYLGLQGKVDPTEFYSNDLIDQINQFDVQKVRDQAKTYKATN